MTTIKSIQDEKYFWAAFTIENQFKIKKEELKKLKKHTVNIALQLAKKKVPERCRINRIVIKNLY